MPEALLTFQLVLACIDILFFQLPLALASGEKVRTQAALAALIEQRIVLFALAQPDREADFGLKPKAWCDNRFPLAKASGNLY